MPGICTVFTGNYVSTLTDRAKWKNHAYVESFTKSFLYPLAAPHSQYGTITDPTLFYANTCYEVLISKIKTYSTNIIKNVSMLNNEYVTNPHFSTKYLFTHLNTDGFTIEPL